VLGERNDMIDVELAVVKDEVNRLVTDEALARLAVQETTFQGLTLIRAEAGQCFRVSCHCQIPGSALVHESNTFFDERGFATNLFYRDNDTARSRPG